MNKYSVKFINLFNNFNLSFFNKKKHKSKFIYQIYHNFFAKYQDKFK
jgi:hypothetical protein